MKSDRENRFDSTGIGVVGAGLAISLAILLPSMSHLAGECKKTVEFVNLRDEIVNEFRMTDEWKRVLSSKNDALYTSLSEGEITPEYFTRNYKKNNATSTVIEVLEGSDNEELKAKYEEVEENYQTNVAKNAGAVVGTIFGTLGTVTFGWCASIYGYLYREHKKKQKANREKTNWQHNSVKDYMDYVHGAGGPQGDKEQCDNRKEVKVLTFDNGSIVQIINGNNDDENVMDK